MLEDTHSDMMETAGQDAETETLDALDNEPVEATFDDEEGPEAADTHAEGGTGKAAEDTAEAAPEEDGKIRLSYRGEEKEYTREELVALAQKGLDYDGLRADRDRLRQGDTPEGRLIDRYAKAAGMSREQYLRFAAQAAEAREAAPEARKLMESGVPEAEARELALRRLREQQADRRAREDRETEAREQEARDAGFRELADYGRKNGLDLSALEPEVIRNIAEGGMRPLEAYLAWEHKQLRLENSQLRQNERNKEKNPGRVTQAGPKAKAGDGFDAGFAEVFDL